MSQILLEYGIFLAKVLTFVLAFLGIITVIFSLARKRGQESHLLITSLNERMNDIKLNFQAETLTKAEWKKWTKAQKQAVKEKKRITNRLFVIRFEGDIRASQVTHLREMISAIIEIAHPQDEVLVVLESAGGFVHGYGLAASQLARLKEHKLTLTVAIDKCAASGGYLMACVADKIIAAPFAIVGSIGVLAQLPNFHRLLDKHNIDFEQHTAGKFKRTLTLFGKNTDKGREKFQEEIEETHQLFKNYIVEYRPQINIDEVATGEHWHAIDAVKNHLVDEIKTSDDLILNKMKEAHVFEISYEVKQKLTEKLTQGIFAGIEKGIIRLLSLLQV